MRSASDSSIDRPAGGTGRPVVLQVLPELGGGGVERGTVEVARAVVRAGGTAIVASAGGMLEDAVAQVGARHVTLPLATKNPLVIQANIGRLARLIREREVDIVHARSRAPAWSAFAAARRTGRAFVTTFHGTYGARNRLKRLYNSVMARGDRVIAISQFIGRHAAETYSVPSDRLRVIPRGVDISVFDPDRMAADRLQVLRTAWDLPAGVPVAMLPGRLTRWKGQAVLIEALARMRRRDVLCLLVGDEQGRAGYRAELEALARRHGVAPRVRIAGDCRDMAAAYLLADLVVSASTDPEAFGRVAIEAQAMGRPVIATDHGGARETVVPGETGWLVPPGDPGALARALDDAFALPPEERVRLGVRGMSRVRAEFTVDLMCERTLAVYRELLTDARSRTAA